MLTYIIFSASNDLIPQIQPVCSQLSFKALLPVHLPQLDFPDKLPPNLKLSIIPWNSPTLYGILQHTSHLLIYLKCGVWEPMDSAPTRGLSPSQNPYQESSSFHIPQGTLSTPNALPTLLLGQGPASVEELFLPHSILSNLSSLLKPPFTHSFHKSDVNCSCAKQCAVACHPSHL